MKRLFKIIKKKKQKRRLSVLWVFLIAIELFCPVFCDEPTFAATQSSATALECNFTESENSLIGESISVSESRGQENQQTVCNDECLCHAAAIPALFIQPKEPVFFRCEQITFYFGEPVHNSLPPPYHPPKLS